MAGDSNDGTGAVGVVVVFAIIEYGIETVKVPLADGIILVSVALSATYRQAEENRTGRVDAIDYGFDAELLVIGSSLLVDQRVAMETRGDQLFHGWRIE